MSTPFQPHVPATTDENAFCGTGIGVRELMFRTSALSWGVEVHSNSTRSGDCNEACDRQDRSAPNPRRLMDHEAGSRIGEIAAPLSNPNQAEQN